MDGGVERVGKKTLNGRSKVIDMSEIYIVHTSEIKYLKQIQWFIGYLEMWENAKKMKNITKMLENAKKLKNITKMLKNK